MHVSGCGGRQSRRFCACHAMLARCISYDSVCLSVCLSVHPSLTSRYCDPTRCWHAGCVDIIVLSGNSNNNCTSPRTDSARQTSPVLSTVDRPTTIACLSHLASIFVYNTVSDAACRAVPLRQMSLSKLLLTYV